MNSWDVVKKPKRDMSANKHGGNFASIEAHKIALKAAGKTCQLVLRWINAAPDGLTSKEILTRLDVEDPRSDGKPWTPNALSPRLTELREARLVAPFEIAPEKTLRRGGAEVLYPANVGLQKSLFQEVA